MMRKLFVLFVVSLLVAGNLMAQSLRAPAYPLITVDPYFSIWSFGNELNGQPTVHWTGTEKPLQGIIRVDGKAYYFLGEPIPIEKTILPLSEKSGVWKFTTSRPSGNWQAINYKADSWKRAEGAFSNGDDQPAPNKWDTKDLWLRRSFNLKTTSLDQLMLNLHHDDNIEVYLNGVLALKKVGWNNSAERFAISKEAKAALKKGENIMAIHVANTAGGAYLDAGLVDRVNPEVPLAQAKQMSVKVSATQTSYQFNAGGVALDLTFTAPLLPDDLNLLSRPANYITFTTHSTDNKLHDVQVYFSAGSHLAVHTTDQKVTWERTTADGLDLLRVGTTSQNILGRKGDNVRIDWGYLYLGIPAGNKNTSVMAASSASVNNFVKQGTLTITDDPEFPRAVEDKPLTLAAAHDFGKISSKEESTHLILAYDELEAIEYFHQRLKPWWKKTGISTTEMLSLAEKEYDKVLNRCTQFDETLHQQMIAAGGEKYAALCELAFRQSIAAHKLVEGPGGNPLFFSKENFSNGSIATVDITYPSSPMYLLYNPVLLKGMMIPILCYSQSGKYNHPFAAHDVGTYPIANGMTYGEPMPVEESGNMLVLAAAVTKAEGNTGFAKQYWDVLTTWAHYLKDNGLDPANQLCTDDFAGHLAHNANLSIKAIMGLASYGYIADKMGMQDTGTVYTELARKYAKEWMQMSDDGDHYSLTFDKKGTWSQKYNLVWDQVLDMNIFPKSVAEKEIAYYLTKQNKYGLPLDSRKTYTKSDWITWTAAMAGNEKDFDALIDKVYKYVDETPARVPMSDWYETTNARQVGFQARSVVGGYFIKALDKKWNTK